VKVSDLLVVSILRCGYDKSMFFTSLVYTYRPDVPILEQKQPKDLKLSR
jgi:hypothetical protein